MTDILAVLWVFFPIGIANMTPVFAAKIPPLLRWYTPLDNGRKFQGKRILGNHKTWLGLVSGTVMGGVTAVAQYWIVQSSPEAFLFLPTEYSQINPTLFGVVCGFGALAGDAIKSFFKRRAEISSGDSWIPFDQLDYVVSAILLSYPFLRLTPHLYLVALALFFILHIAATNIGYLLGLKQSRV